MLKEAIHHSVLSAIQELFGFIPPRSFVSHVAQGVDLVLLIQIVGLVAIQIITFRSLEGLALLDVKQER